MIFRERDESGGEVIRQVNRKGGILTSEICVLDDISRAPGEALNVLLRVLNERKFGDDRIPLLTAIATGNPTKEDYYNEPLDPANLDRFTIQMRTLGLLQRNMWQAASAVIDRYADGHLGAEGLAAGDAGGVGQCHRITSQGRPHGGSKGLAAGISQRASE